MHRLPRSISIGCGPPLGRPAHLLHLVSSSSPTSRFSASIRNLLCQPHQPAWSSTLLSLRHAHSAVRHRYRPASPSFVHLKCFCSTSSSPPPSTSSPNSKYPPLATESPSTTSPSSSTDNSSFRTGSPLPSSVSSSRSPAVVGVQPPPLAAALTAELASMPPPPPDSRRASLFARPFNTAMAEYPIHLILSLATFELLSFNITHSLLLYTGVHFSSTFALAYLISVPVRKSALPKVVLGVPIGIVFATIFPWFKEIRITELRNNPVIGRAWNGVKGLFVSKPSTPPPSTPVVAGGQTTPITSSAVVATSSKRQWWNPIRWTAYLARQTDRYGLALLVGYRVAGAVIILSIYYLLEWGVPIRQIEHYASYFGYDTNSKYVGKASEYAGALVCSAVLFPVTLMLAPFLARGLQRITSTIFRSRKTPPLPPAAPPSHTQL